MSKKQELLGALIKHAFVQFRCQFYVTWKELLLKPFSLRNRFAYYRDLANLLHRVGETVHSPEFTETDISFLNLAVPQFLANPNNQWDLTLIRLLVQLRDCVPAEKVDSVTWHPSKLLRQKLHH